MRRIDLFLPPQSGMSEGEYSLLIEQNEYLSGALYADEDHRMDMDPTRDVSKEIDAYGTGSKAFWRGVIETAGNIAIHGGMKKFQKTDAYTYPRLKLSGSYAFLKKLLDFLEEELGERGRPWDVNGKLAFQCSGGGLEFTGRTAQDVVRVLYMGQSVARESSRRIVHRIIAWQPKR